MLSNPAIVKNGFKAAIILAKLSDLYNYICFKILTQSLYELEFIIINSLLI